ncbi:MAG: hypothetical protein CMN13_09265 [Roseobacter sp.]|jgi:hypothetical protein|uniref:Lipoprotein n=3 Tax=Sulfitobacter TaxID=60136 RepID=A0AAX3AD18_9RHOB|nr:MULTISPECIES: hypothetical protein [Sulfitobacter]MAJ78147.1 hypothetical protein [Roseobacter sp.]NKX48046.1 hypothetical protein [Rhodobacteraceae bacterium R_SAG8]AXI51461.1 hypothetical protein C1J04_11285 [Sulfitobacter sp. SK025]EAP81015.1 lipoprotein, putative [Sulfitobacter sp. NAS-14.1]EAP84631.1 lipoprotein, putative [Sulfitobacter sp. EE-36]|tara:strand:- start:497 stop:865 length:369 start_codon:yes stop_codon:yes gene_type:complete
MMLPLVLGACETQAPMAEDFIPEYRGVETKLLDGDLVQFDVAMTKAQSSENVAEYAECAAARYTLIRGFGFARHVRTNVEIEGGVWHADAVYTISPSLPAGLKTIDAEVTVQNCMEKGIPTV